MPLEGEKEQSGSPPPYGRVDGFEKRASEETKYGMEESAAVIQIIIAILCGMVAGGVICFPDRKSVV